MAKDWTQDEAIKELERIIAKQDDEIERLRRHTLTKMDIMLKQADEIERLRGAFRSIKKVPNSEAAYGIIRVIVNDALKEDE